MPNVTNLLNPPQFCDVCASINVELTTNDRVYGKVIGEWPYIYFCNDCRASVSCHKNTHTPMGRMADKETKQLRQETHRVFDLLWKSGLMTRSQAYNRMAYEVGVLVNECHISWFNTEQLSVAKHWAEKYFNENHSAIQRRKAKRNEKAIARIQRERSAIERRKNGRRQFKD